MFLSETCLVDCSHYFVDGYEFYFSSDPGSPEAGVGVVVSPEIRPFVLGFTGQASRICEVEVTLQGTQMRVFGLYAPTQAAGREYAAARDQFWYYHWSNIF